MNGEDPMTISRIARISLVMIVLSAMGARAQAAPAAPAKPAAVCEAYPGLASAGLTHAALAELPKGTLLRAGGLTIHQKDLTDEIAKAPAGLREQLRKNAFFVLERIATGKLLLQAAKAGPGAAQGDDGKVIESYLQRVARQARVTDEEVATFYARNKAMFGGAALAKVKDSIGRFLAQQKQQRAAREHVRTLGKRTAVTVSASWTKRAAALARNNPVDKARASGKPSLVDFGADGCRPCEMMTPILAALKQKHAGKVNVLFVHVRKEQVLAARYGIRSIPVQVFFDRDGKEAFRHVGFFPQNEIEKKLAEISAR